MVIEAEKVNGRWMLPLPEDLQPSNGQPVRFRVERDVVEADSAPSVQSVSNNIVLAAGDAGCDRYAQALSNLAK